MLLHRRQTDPSSDALTSDIMDRIQRLEGERRLRFPAAQIAPLIGGAIEIFAQTIRAPAPRGSAAGLARARSEWRYANGTFMPKPEKYEVNREAHERYAAGGRARAAHARRAADRTFVSEER